MTKQKKSPWAWSDFLLWSIFFNVVSIQFMADTGIPKLEKNHPLLFVKLFSWKLPLIWTWIIIDKTLLFVGCLINNVPAWFPWSKKYWLINWSGHQWNDYFVIHYGDCLPRGVCCFWDTRQRYSFKAFILSQSQSTPCFLLDIRSFHLVSLQNLIQHSWSWINEL